MKKIKHIIIMLLFPLFMRASEVNAYIYISTWGAETKPGGVPTDIRGAAMNLTNWILGFVTMLATLIVIYGGILYLTSMGNSDQVDKAKKTISSGIIGLVITGLAYAIVIVVTSVILQS